MRLYIGLALALALGGCAHRSAAGIMGANDSSLDVAYRDVMTGGHMNARADGFIVERVSDAQVRVMREAGLEKVPAGVSDESIAKQLRERHGDLDVKANAGMVTLRGTVATEKMALAAIRDALDMNGVMAVSSELNYPAAQQASGYRR